MKPRLVRTPGVPGISSPQWWCKGDAALGYGDTPGEAYSNWVRGHMNSGDTKWFQQPAPKPMNRFQRWVLRYGAWY